MMAGFFEIQTFRVFISIGLSTRSSPPPSRLLSEQGAQRQPVSVHQLQFVKSFITEAGCPLSIAEHLRIRRCLSLLWPKELQVGWELHACSVLDRDLFV